MIAWHHADRVSCGSSFSNPFLWPGITPDTGAPIEELTHFSQTRFARLALVVEEDEAVGTIGEPRHGPFGVSESPRCQAQLVQ